MSGSPATRSRRPRGRRTRIASVEIDAERPLTAQVIGKSNAEVVGTDTDKFDLPSGGGTSELQFQLKAKGAGPVKVLVVVRQGSVLNTTITLTATAGSKADVGTKRRRTP